MKAQTIQPIVLNKKQVSYLLNMNIKTFDAPKMQDFLTKKKFPCQIPNIGWAIKDVEDWIESINPNRNTNKNSTNWDDVFEN
jgi:nitrous oxide reductase accessory protein NosL